MTEISLSSFSTGSPSSNTRSILSLSSVVGNFPMPASTRVRRWSNMAKNKYVVRVVIQKREVDDPMYFTVSHTFPEFLENLRYAGIAQVHDETEKTILFDIYAPAGVDTKIWAELNARRMQSFGYNAIAAPEWKAFSGNILP